MNRVDLLQELNLERPSYAAHSMRSGYEILARVHAIHSPNAFNSLVSFLNDALNGLQETGDGVGTNQASYALLVEANDGENLDKDGILTFLEAFLCLLPDRVVLERQLSLEVPNNIRKIVTGQRKETYAKVAKTVDKMWEMTKAAWV